ncbi:MAG: hypothetical protein EOP49_49065, partial [Sphingobacteriales bacterium]
MNKLVSLNGLLFVCCNKGVYVLDPTKPERIELLKGTAAADVLDVCSDQLGNYWMATSSGALMVNAQGARKFDYSNGLTSSQVTFVFADRENNIWFSTGRGEGVFMYNNPGYLQVNAESGLRSTSVMSLCSGNQRTTWIGSSGDGVYRADSSLRKVDVSTDGREAKSIMACHFAKNALWVASSDKGLWKYAEGRVKNFTTANSALHSNFLWSLYEDSKENLWIGTQDGVSVYTHRRFIKMDEVRNLTFSFLEIGADSMLCGTYHGIALLTNGLNHFKSKHAILHEVSCNCMVKVGNEVWIGTDDNGILIWNFVTDGLR